MRRLLPLVLLAAAAVPAPAGAATPSNWNTDQQREVVEAGLLPRLDDGRFHGERPLTGAQLGAALGALAAESGVPAVAGSSAATVSVTAFDERLVTQLGLADVAAHVQSVARGAGLQPAEELRHRGRHPLPGPALQPPGARTTRSSSTRGSRSRAPRPRTRSPRCSTAATGRSRTPARSSPRFSLPAYGADARRALRVAVSKIGMPYVWGGETDAVSSTFGYQAHGGYDCSGFVWRVFKLTGQPAGARIGGRTAAQMAGEIRKAQRLHLEEVRAGDLIFFGRAKFSSKATERGVDHVGIALSEHWMIHSSSQGVYVSSLDDEWRRDRFTWARRVL